MTDISTGQTVSFSPSSSAAVLPGYEGQDVFNPAMEDLFAEGYSTLVNTNLMMSLTGLKKG